MLFQFAIFLASFGLFSGCLAYKPNENSSSGLNSSITVGNNADYAARNRRLAWFSGQQNLSYCVVIGQGIDSPSAKVKEVVERAFGKWVTLIKERKINETLSARSIPLLPTELTFTENCQSADIIAGVGSDFQEAELSHAIASNRESTISGGFDLNEPSSSHKRQVLLWVAGSNAVTKPTDYQVSKPVIFDIRDSTPGELEIPLLYNFGRLFGNVNVPGTILETLPEELLYGARQQDKSCLEKRSNPQIEFAYALTFERTTDGEKVPVYLANGQKATLTFNGNNYQVYSHGNKEPKLILSSAWSPSNPPRPSIVSTTEVFAIDQDTKEEDRLYFKQVTISGYSHRKINQQTFEGYETLQLNQSLTKTKLIMRCKGQVHSMLMTDPPAVATAQNDPFGLKRCQGLQSP